MVKAQAGPSADEGKRILEQYMQSVLEGRLNEAVTLYRRYENARFWGGDLPPGVASRQFGPPGLFYRNLNEHVETLRKAITAWEQQQYDFAFRNLDRLASAGFTNYKYMNGLAEQWRSERWKNLTEFVAPFTQRLQRLEASLGQGMAQAGIQTELEGLDLELRTRELMFPLLPGGDGQAMEAKTRLRPLRAKLDELKSKAPAGDYDLYSESSTLTLEQGLNALLAHDITAFEDAGLKYIDILEKAHQDGMGQVVEDALTHFKAGLKKTKEQRAFEELELFINLMNIKDPFEGWRALGKAMSERWPKGLSAVQAVREMRR